MSRNRVTVVAMFAFVAAAMMPQLARAQYDYSVASTFYAQTGQYYCGPATAQMILSSVSPAVTIPTQNNLYTQIVAGNPGTFGDPPASLSTNGNFYTTPNGLQTALQANAPAYTWVAYNIAPGNANAGLNSANRTLAYDVSHYQVAAGAMILYGYHWVTVVGVNTNVQPTFAGNFTVNGFYVRDPWTGTSFATDSEVPGLGYNAYLATTGDDAKWASNFVPVNAAKRDRPASYDGQYGGNYVFVADPDSPDTIDPVFPGAPGNLGSELTGSHAKTLTASDIAAVSGLAGDPAFEGGGFTMTGELEDLANAQLSEDEWLVPYDDGSGNLTGVALIDAETGVLDAASWNEGGTLPASFLLELDAMDNGQDVAQDNTFVPEPASLALLVCGGLGLSIFVLRRSRRCCGAVA